MLAVEDNILGDGIGRIVLTDWSGGDLANVNAARASYETEHAEFTDADSRLIARLGVDQHSTPFRHTVFHLQFVAPEFVARQLYKHAVGAQQYFPDQPWNEASQRFALVSEDWYIPDTWHAQHAVNKQRAGEPLGWLGTETASEIARRASQNSYDSYRRLLALGICREEARLVLPLNVYTSWVYTASLQAVVHMSVLRAANDAQKATQAYGHALERLCRHLAPRSWDAVYHNHPHVLKAHVDRLEAQNADAK